MLLFHVFMTSCTLARLLLVYQMNPLTFSSAELCFLVVEGELELCIIFVFIHIFYVLGVCVVYIVLVILLLIFNENILLTAIVNTIYDCVCEEFVLCVVFRQLKQVEFQNFVYSFARIFTFFTFFLFLFIMLIKCCFFSYARTLLYFTFFYSSITNSNIKILEFYLMCVFVCMRKGTREKEICVVAL